MEDSPEKTANKKKKTNAGQNIDWELFICWCSGYRFIRPDFLY